MIKAERQDRIVEICAAQGTATVGDIAHELGVSEMTIRRDLAELSDQGRVTRVHGGAKAPDSAHGRAIAHESAHREKRLRNAEQKRSIASRAAALVRERETVFLGAGTTVELMAGLLPEMPLRVITNSLPVFNLLEGREELDLVLVGGSYRSRTGAFVGPLAEDMVGSLGMDKAFMGANGILGEALFTSNTEEGCLQRLAFGKAAERYVLADSSKLGTRDFYRFYSLRDVDALITDDGLADEDREALERHCAVLV